MLPSLSRRRHRAGSSEDALAAQDRELSTWRAGLPPAPVDLLETAHFHLTREEAGFLIDRLVDSHPDSLLTRLARAGRHARCDFIWEHPDLAEFPGVTRRLIAHAEVFSMVMYGASLLYNLMLSELRQQEEWIACSER